MTTLQKFTVIAITEDNGQILSFHVHAEDKMSAFSAAAAANNNITLIASLPGWLKKDADVAYAGSALVDASVALEQPEVFGTSPYTLTAGDVQSVLEAYSLRVTDTQGKSFETMADELIDELDYQHIMETALGMGTPHEMQQAAFNEIHKALVKQGVIEF